MRAKLAAQLESSEEKLREFARIRAGMVERRVDPFRIAVLDLGIEQQRAKLRWLERMIGELGARQSKRRAV